MRLKDYLDADWRRLHEFAGMEMPRRTLLRMASPRFAPVLLLRLAQCLHTNGWPRLAKLASLANLVLFGLEVPTRLEIGAGLVLPHSQGTILGAARIGSNVTIYQQVTLGAQLADFHYNPALRPSVGAGVIITAGAKVLGPVRLGDESIVGANAVVLTDVPPGAVAVGVPARIVERSQENS